MAFEQVCPERTDLIHKNYRKLCSVLVDIEEWGQVIIIGMLTFSNCFLKFIVILRAGTMQVVMKNWSN